MFNLAFDNSPADRWVSHRTARHQISMVLCILLLAGCAMPRLIPVQMARVAQLESYEQFFTIGQAKGTSEAEQMNAMAEIDGVFGEMIGDSNWQALKDLYGFGAIRYELGQEKISLRGSFAMMIYLDPTSQDAFLIEGQGRYFLIRRDDGLIMLQGAFVVQPSRHRIAELDGGVLPVDIELITTRIPGKETYYHESKVVYEIEIDTSLSREGIYALDYAAKHKVFLSGNEIGYLTLDTLATSGPGEKLIDLRGRQFLKNDYGSILARDE